MRLEEWPRSIFFAAEQSPDLVRETHRLFRLYSEPAFDAWRSTQAAAHPSPATRDGVRDTTLFLRLALDLLLLSHPSEESPGLASRVEAYAIPSFEISSHVSELPSGFAIGISSFVELLGTVAYWLPLAFRISELGPIVPVRDTLADLDEAVGSFLRLYWWRDPADVVYTLRLPGPIDASDPRAVLLEAQQRDVWDLVWVFALCHEIVHIELRHFTKPGPLLSAPFLQELPDELRWEVEADCGSFAMLSNYYRMYHHFTCRSEETVLMRAYRDRGAFERMSRSDFVYRLSWNRATETMEAFYAVMTLALALAERAGEGLLATKLQPIIIRKLLVRRYMRWMQEEELARDLGYGLWGEQDTARERMHDLYVKHAVANVVPRILARDGAT